jgi:hypothetical protein
MRFDGDYPKKSKGLKTHAGDAVGEFRSNGSQSVIWGQHPAGHPYTFVVRQPALTIGFESIRWPSISEPPNFTQYTHVVSSDKEAVIAQSLESYCVNGESYCVNSIEDAVRLTLAVAPRRNNASLFKLARALLLLPPLSSAELFTTFDRWFDETKKRGFARNSRQQYLDEFMNAIRTAKKPLDKSPIDLAWERVQVESPPKEVEYFVGDELAQQLLCLCFQLHTSAGGQPWFLASRDAARHLKTSHTCCAKLLAGFVAMRILAVTDPGTMHKARCYAWKGGAQ